MGPASKFSASNIAHSVPGRGSPNFPVLLGPQKGAMLTTGDVSVNPYPTLIGQRISSKGIRT